jgi:hypothetical protein
VIEHFGVGRPGSGAEIEAGFERLAGLRLESLDDQGAALSQECLGRADVLLVVMFLRLRHRPRCGRWNPAATNATTANSSYATSASMITRSASSGFDRSASQSARLIARSSRRPSFNSWKNEADSAEMLPPPTYSEVRASAHFYDDLANIAALRPSI